MGAQPQKAKSGCGQVTLTALYRGAVLPSPPLDLRIENETTKSGCVFFRGGFPQCTGYFC